MNEERTLKKVHFHIDWNGKLDWERFGSRKVAAERANELAHPDELFTIEAFDDDCPQCRVLAGKVFAGGGTET